MIIALCIGLLFNASACFVIAKKDNGKHKGWYKNKRNNHNPRSTKKKGKSYKLIIKSRSTLIIQENIELINS
jgi:hypothetical protein